MKKLFNVFFLSALVLSMLLHSTVVLSVSAWAYSDIPRDHWAFSFIDSLSTRLAINGYPDGTFRPEQPVKVGEFIKLVVNSESYCSDYKEPENGEHWAYQYVVKFKNVTYNNVFERADEYDNYDTLERNITREEMAYFIGKYYYEYKKASITIKYGDLSNLEHVSDRNDISDKFLSYVNFCLEYNLINGYPDGSFKPKSELTRAEAAKAIYILGVALR